jgi:hypothetical protein
MTSTVQLESYGLNLLTRDQGARVRADLQSLMDQQGPDSVIEIVLDGIQAISPSFVDEALGRLLLNNGEQRFRQHVRVKSEKEVTRRLVNRVLGYRLAELRKAQGT